MSKNTEHQPDEAFLTFARFVEEATDLEGEMHHSEEGVAMQIESVEMSMPIELDITVDEDGKILFGAIPPLYYVETSVMPVYHQLTITLEAEKPMSYE